MPTNQRPFRSLLSCALSVAILLFAAMSDAGADEIHDDIVGEMRLKTSGEIGGDAEARARWVTFVAAGSVALYGATAWWNDELSSRFRARNEGWFGRDTIAGGTDKLGHGFTGYLGTRLISGAYRAAGLGAEAARDRAAIVSLATLTAAEIIDGFTERFRFSKEDALMNGLGVGVGWALERYPDLDAVIDLRISYRRSAQAHRSGERDPIADYSGQTYLVAVKLSGLETTARVPVLRHVELLAGYHARGYEPGEPLSARSRERVLGIGINLASLFGLTKRDEIPARVAAGTLEYVQIPAAAVWHRHDID